MRVGQCWDVSCSYCALIEKKTEENEILACSRIHLGSWRNTTVGNSFFRVLPPAWSRHNVLQPSKPGVVSLLQSHHWERQSHVQALPLSPILSDLTSVLPSCFLNRGWACIDAENILPLWDTYLYLMQGKPHFEKHFVKREMFLKVLTLRTFPSLGDTDRGKPLFRSLMVPGQGSCKQPLFLLDASDAK